MQDNLATKKWIPTDAYLFFPHENECKNTYGARLIFDGSTKFDAHETKMIEQFRAYAEKHDYPLKSIWVDNLILRFLHANAFKMDKTLTTVKEHTTWRETKLPVPMTDDIRQFLEKGYLYIHGRDHKYRPIIVFNASLIDVKTFDVDLMIDALTYFFEFLIANLLLPGQVENWVFITDLKGLGLASIPFKPIKKLLGYLQHNYRGRLTVMYIINAPTTVYIPWQMAKKFLEEVTVKKIQFYKTQIPEPLFEHTNREQVEKKYGGTAPDLKTFWPPVFPSSNYHVKKEDTDRLVSKEAYRNLYLSERLRSHKVEMSLLQDKPEPTEKAKGSRPITTHLAVTTNTKADPNPSDLKANDLSVKNQERCSSPDWPSSRPTAAEPEYDMEDRSPLREDDLDESDYVDLMDENTNITVKDPYRIREFTAYFLIK